MGTYDVIPMPILTVTSSNLFFALFVCDNNGVGWVYYRFLFWSNTSHHLSSALAEYSYRRCGNQPDIDIFGLVSCKASRFSLSFVAGDVWYFSKELT